MSSYWICPDSECRAEVPEEEPECLACLDSACPACFDARGAHPDGEWCSSATAAGAAPAAAWEQESQYQAWQRDDETQMSEARDIAF